MVPNEQTILAHIQSGHTEQFGVLYDAYLEPIYRFVYYKTQQKEVAEDLTSSIFLKAMEQIHRYNATKGSFQTWLYKIARNTVIDYYRTHRIAEKIEDAWDVVSHTDIERDVHTKLQFEELQKTLQNFSSAERDILLMRLWEGLSYSEIASILGKSEASCKMQMRRTLQKLQQSLPLVLFLHLLTQII